jgi:hypothetical protein
MCAIDKEPFEQTRDSATFILYLPEGETQELTLLFLHYLLRNRRQKVVYLGAGTSLNDLRDACQSLQPDFVYTILHEPFGRQTVQGYVDQAVAHIGSATLLLSGPQIFMNPVKLPSNARILNGLGDTLQFLDTIQLRKMNARLQ